MHRDRIPVAPRAAIVVRGVKVVPTPRVPVRKVARWSVAPKESVVRVAKVVPTRRAPEQNVVRWNVAPKANVAPKRRVPARMAGRWNVSRTKANSKLKGPPGSIPAAPFVERSHFFAFVHARWTFATSHM